MQTTGGFTSIQLLNEEQILTVPSLDISGALEIGEIAKSLGQVRNLPIAVEVRLVDWIVYHASLPGSKPENDWWMLRKARVVMLKHHSTMYERVSAEERGIDWHKENNFSGLPQVEDHLLGVEVLTEFLARKGELL
jgi:uncharacterized protein (UPF0303 family)